MRDTMVTYTVKPGQEQESAAVSATATPGEPIGRTVEHADGALHIVDRAGEEPAIVLMHGFPDDHHIYDRLAPLLAPRRVVTFDWLGYCRSSRREKGSFDRSSRQQDLDAVIDLLALQRVVLVGHDASGPEAITFALHRPEQVAHVVLLNSYYGRGDGLRFPEMIRLFADPDLTALADAMVEDPEQRLWLLTHSARQFGMYPLKPDGLAATSILAQYFGSEQQPDALAEIRAWTADLFGALDSQDVRVAAGDLGRLSVPTTLIFGSRDSYLGVKVAQRLAQLLGTADVHVIDGASHWPQWEEPDAVASIVERVLRAP
jgi:haloalkane dehalogenase